jgi:hypothetical protein
MNNSTPLFFDTFNPEQFNSVFTKWTKTGLKKQQTLTELKMNQFVALKEHALYKKYVNAAAVLKKDVERYGEGEFSHMEYLKGISYRISTI